MATPTSQELTRKLRAPAAAVSWQEPGDITIKASRDGNLAAGTIRLEGSRGGQRATDVLVMSDDDAGIQRGLQAIRQDLEQLRNGWNIPYEWFTMASPVVLVAWGRQAPSLGFRLLSLTDWRAMLDQIMCAPFPLEMPGLEGRYRFRTPHDLLKLLQPRGLDEATAQTITATLGASVGFCPLERWLAEPPA